MVYGGAMRFSRPTLLMGAVALSATAALAGPQPGVIAPRATTNTTVTATAVATPVASAAPSATTPTAVAPSDASVATTSTADAGASSETADQIARRKAYVDRTAAHIRDLVHANGKAVTDEERAAISRHWRHSMRLLRVRNLAEADSDQADVARVDALLATADMHLDAKLKALNIKAPKKGAN